MFAKQAGLCLTSHYAGNVQNIYITFLSCNLSSIPGTTTGPILLPGQPITVWWKRTFIDFKPVLEVGAPYLLLPSPNCNLAEKPSSFWRLKILKPSTRSETRHCLLDLFEGHISREPIFHFRLVLLDSTFQSYQNAENNGRKLCWWDAIIFILWSTHGEMTYICVFDAWLIITENIVSHPPGEEQIILKLNALTMTSDLKPPDLVWKTSFLFPTMHSSLVITSVNFSFVINCLEEIWKNVWRNVTNLGLFEKCPKKSFG